MLSQFNQHVSRKAIGTAKLEVLRLAPIFLVYLAFCQVIRLRPPFDAVDIAPVFDGLIEVFNNEANLVEGSSDKGWKLTTHAFCSSCAFSRSSATSTIMSSWPPTIRRLPSSTRISTVFRPYFCAATSEWRRKLEYTPA